MYVCVCMCVPADILPLAEAFSCSNTSCCSSTGINWSIFLLLRCSANSGKVMVSPVFFLNALSMFVILPNFSLAMLYVVG